MAAETGLTLIEVDAFIPLSDKEKRLVEAYTDRKNRNSYGKKQPSMRLAGYAESTVKAKSGAVFSRPQVIRAINERVTSLASQDRMEQAPVDEVKAILGKMVTFDVLDCYEWIKYTVKDAKGKLIEMREPVMRDLVEAGIDGRLIGRLRVTKTQKGITTEVEPPNKIMAARLLAQLHGALDENTPKNAYQVNMYFGENEVVQPKDVNNFKEFFPHAGSGAPIDGG